MNDNLIPLITVYDNGRCEDCNGRIIVYSQDLVIFTLNVDGSISDHEVEYSNMVSYCENCKKYFDMVKTGIGYARRKYLEEQEKRWRREKGIIDIEKSKDIREPNPFGEISRRVKDARRSNICCNSNSQ